MKIIVWVLFPILILAILNKKGILPNTFFYILVIIISIIGAYFFWNRLYSIFYRDPMNYQEYDWNFNPNDAPSGNGSSSTNPWDSLNNGGGICIGDTCCTTGMSWDPSLNVCIITSNTNSSDVANTATPVTTDTTASTTSDSTQESFVNQVFTKHAYAFKKPDVLLGHENINPSNSNSFIHTGKY